MEEQEEYDEYKDERELFERALELKDKLGLPSVDTALLIIISQDIDTIRYNNCD